MVNSEVNITVVEAMASTAIRLRVRAARSPLSERLDTGSIGNFHAAAPL